MHKPWLFFILFLFPFSLLAQQKTKIILQSFDHITVENKTNTSYLRNPVFRQDNATLACDSAVFYESKNVFDAFDRVHINQADTINIYSDRLTYDGNTKNAHLTSNVKMIDRESTLTTNILDYNLGTKVGTYVTGGKVVNKDVTLTSKNGYYFSNSRDAYFRYNVVVVTPESTITSDTLRYNTLTNWTYFYGPTNIKGKDDNLYTENGAYNTKTQYAYFGKKNLYTQDSKSLKGDSLYYDGIAGYGKAVRNIIFKDTVDKTVMYGQLAYYYKIDQRTIVTKNPYIGMGTSDSVMVNNKLRPDSLWMGADTLETQMVLLKTLKLISSPVLKKDNEMGEEEKSEEKVGAKKGIKTEEKDGKLHVKKNDKAIKPGVHELPKPEISKSDSSKVVLPGVKDSLQKAPLLLKKDSIPIKKDNIPIKKKEIPPAKKILKPVIADSTILVTLKAAEVIQPEMLKDSTKNAKTDSVNGKKIKGGDPKKIATGKTPAVKAGSAKTGAAAVAGKAGAANKKPAGTPVIANKTASALKGDKKTLAKDSLPVNPADTILTRAIKAYHHVRVFKSNMQARADSLFYTSSDSTLRWYGSPVLWAEGSQQTGDTIYLRLRNKQLNTSQVLSNGFVVNVNADSAHFNQIKGKLITGFFVDSKLNRMFVDGNAESIYYNREKDSIYTEMNQTVSSRIKIIFKDKEINDIVTIKDTEGARTPMPELKEDVFLTGFTWKPELRPLSKKEVINGKPKPKPGAKKGPGPKGPKLPAKDKEKDKEKENGKPMGGEKDPPKAGTKVIAKTPAATAVPGAGLPVAKPVTTAKDSLGVKQILHSLPLKKDSAAVAKPTIEPLTLKKDSAAVVKPAAVQKDSVSVAPLKKQ